MRIRKKPTTGKFWMKTFGFGGTRKGTARLRRLILETGSFREGMEKFKGK